LKRYESRKKAKRQKSKKLNSPVWIQQDTIQKRMDTKTLRQMLLPGKVTLDQRSLLLIQARDDTGMRMPLQQDRGTHLPLRGQREWANDVRLMLVVLVISVA
jgi:hypothetical protein